MNSTATRAIPGSHSLSWGRDLKNQLLTKVEKSRYNIPRTLTLYLNCFSALGCAREQTTTEVCPHEGLLMFKETSSGIKSVTGYGQQWCMESQPKLKRSPGCVCVDTAPFPLGIYYLLKTNLLVSGSSGFLRASCNISPGLQSHN